MQQNCQRYNINNMCNKYKKMSHATIILLLNSNTLEFILLEFILLEFVLLGL